MTRVSPGMWREMEHEVFKRVRPDGISISGRLGVKYRFLDTKRFWLISTKISQNRLSWPPTNFQDFSTSAGDILGTMGHMTKQKKRWHRNILFYHPPKGFCRRIRFRIDKFLKILRPPQDRDFGIPYFIFKIPRNWRFFANFAGIDRKGKRGFCIGLRCKNTLLEPNFSIRNFLLPSDQKFLLATIRVFPGRCQ